MTTRNYLTNLINEKANISMDTTIEVEGKEWGLNIIPLEAIVETICNMDTATQKKCINNLTMIDFKNGDVMHFFTYIAKFIAK